MTPILLHPCHPECKFKKPHVDDCVARKKRKKRKKRKEKKK